MKNVVSKNGVWKTAPLNDTPSGKKFIVTLTPTALDYSGTMDKTVAEIDAAYKAGQQVVFRVMIGANEYADLVCAGTQGDNNFAYPSYSTYGILSSMSGGTLIQIFTGKEDDGTVNTYSTYIYPLTPAT